MRDPFLIFLHVQKCGGTTMRSIIKQNYKNVLNINKGKYKLGWPIIKRFHAMNQNDQEECTQFIQRHDALIGHYPYGVHELLKHPYRYITMLREPADRVLSLYEHWAHSHIANCIGESVHEFLTVNPYAQTLKDNHMVRVFCGTGGFHVPYGKLQREHLKTAKRNMASCDFVGIMEEYDAALVVLQSMFGWHNISYIPRNVTLNRRHKNPYLSLNPKTLDALEQRIALDRELYAYARELWEERHKQTHIKTPFPADIPVPV